MKHDDLSWIYLALALVVLVAGIASGRHDIVTDGLVILATGAIYSTSSKP